MPFFSMCILRKNEDDKGCLELFQKKTYLFFFFVFQFFDVDQFFYGFKRRYEWTESKANCVYFLLLFLRFEKEELISLCPFSPTPHTQYYDDSQLISRRVVNPRCEIALFVIFISIEMVQSRDCDPINCNSPIFKIKNKTFDEQSLHYYIY